MSSAHALSPAYVPLHRVSDILWHGALTSEQRLSSRMLRVCMANGDRQKMGNPELSLAKSTSVPKGYPALRWCMFDINVHKCATLACSTCRRNCLLGLTRAWRAFQRIRNGCAVCKPDFGLPVAVWVGHSELSRFSRCQQGRSAVCQALGAWGCSRGETFPLACLRGLLALLLSEMVSILQLESPKQARDILANPTSGNCLCQEL